MEDRGGQLATADNFPKCRCGKSVRFQAVTVDLDEGFCSDECLDMAMGRTQATQEERNATLHSARSNVAP